MNTNVRKFVVLFALAFVAMFALAACTPGDQVIISLKSVDGETTEVASVDPCGLPGVSVAGCVEQGAVVTDTVEIEEGEVITDTVEIEEGVVVTDTVEIEEGVVLTDTVDLTDTYRGFRLDFPERSIGRVLIEETVVEGPAIHQDRDGNVTVIMKNASATFSSGIVWLYKVGDANSLEDELVFLNNQIKFFNDPSPLWIEPTATPIP